MTQNSSRFMLYNYFRSSASHRVRIALHHKGIEFEYRPVHLLSDGGEQHRIEYTQLNPSHQVPTLVHESGGHSQVIGQSVAILDYLDQVQASPRLFPQEPGPRALCFQICEIINSGMQPLFNLQVLHEIGARFGADQEVKANWTRHWMTLGLTALEKLLKPVAGEFCLGADISAADCFLIPQLYSCDRFQVTLDAHPTLARLRQNCERVPAFQKASPFAQIDTPAELRV